MIIFIPIFLALICPLVALLFAVRLAVAAFSPKVFEQMRRHPVIHAVWGGFALAGALVVLYALNPGLWPPKSIERREQRAKVIERIQAAGGWAALQRDCDLLAAQNQDSGFIWYHLGSTNTLPPAIAALKPWSVTYLPTEVKNNKNELQVPVVSIKVFGLHSTGGHSIPYFGLKVACTTNAESYHPQPSRDGLLGDYYDGCRRITDTIYEVY